MKPGPLAVSASKVRRNNAAPTTSVKVKAICAVTIIFRSRTPPKAVPPRSRSDDISERRPACQAGASPLKRPAATLATKAKSKRRESTPTCNAVGAVPGGRNAMRVRTATGATAIPSNPPSSAIRRLSARSCLASRPREAPRASLVPISRSRADPRARNRPETFKQARPNNTAVTANSTHNGSNSRRLSEE